MKGFLYRRPFFVNKQTQKIENPNKIIVNLGVYL